MSVIHIQRPARLADERDVRNFVESKRIKGEAIRFDAKGVAASSTNIRDARAFDELRRLLKLSPDFGQASEGLDSLADALWRRHLCPLPVPRKVLQNPDRSVTVLWAGCSCRAFVDGFVSLVGGKAGLPARGISRELLDALGHLSKIQATSS